MQNTVISSSLSKQTMKTQKGNYLQEITFPVIISFGTLLKCYQPLSHKNKYDMKKKTVKWISSYLNRNNNANAWNKKKKITK